MNKRVNYSVVEPPVVVNSLGLSKRRRKFDDMAKSGITLNEYGTISSDFSRLVNANKGYELAMLANRLQQIDVPKSKTKDKSFDELVRYMKPRWCQSPKELDDFEQFVLANMKCELSAQQSAIEEQNRKNDEAMESFKNSLKSEIQNAVPKSE